MMMFPNPYQSGFCETLEKQLPILTGRIYWGCIFQDLSISCSKQHILFLKKEIKNKNDNMLLTQTQSLYKECYVGQKRSHTAKAPD